MMTPFRIRAIYLLLYMAMATWRIYYNIFLENAGLKGSEIGLINTLLQAVFVISVTYWGIRADKKGIRPILIPLIIISVVFIISLRYVTQVNYLIFLIPVFAFFVHPAIPLTDAMGTEYAQTDKNFSYGKFRLWGSLGWTIMSVIGGIIFKKWLSVEYIFFIAALLFLSILPYLSTRNKKRTFRPHYEPIRIKDLLKNKPLFLFVGILTLYGITCSPVNSYLNLYFTSLGAGNDIVGYAYALMAVSEIPLFLVANRLLKKWGTPQVILLAITAMLIRFIFYGLFPNIYTGLAVGLLQGISLSFFLVGAVDYMQKLLPEGRDAMAQTFIAGAYIGIGQTAGSLIISMLINSQGMVGVMRIFGAVATACLLATLVYFRKYRVLN